MIDFRAVLASESTRFGQLIARTAPEARVPSCPEWSLADLAWHLTEVQEFWRKIVEGRLMSPEGMDRLARPADAALPEAFRDESTKLSEALGACSGDEACWSWHEPGRNTAWVMRRQAHEALIHRVDAELAAGVSSRIDPVLAADGVDEILTVMLDATDLPVWSTFTASGRTAVIALTDQPRSWSVELGRFFGTSPVSGTTYDEPALRLVPDATDPSARITGLSTDVDLWLWGRADNDVLQVEGDETIVETIREAASIATQ